jgi:RES domain-containing protein
MIHRPELLDALENAPSGPREITAWRHMFGRHPPDQENTRGARWNPADVAAIYLSLARHGAIAEGDHAISAQPLRPRASRFVYAVDLSLVSVLDLSDPLDLSRTGLTDATSPATITPHAKRSAPPSTGWNTTAYSCGQQEVMR